MSLHQKVIAVTGVSSGIGKAAAYHLTMLGAHVVGIDRSSPPPDVQLHAFIAVDLSDPSAIDEGIRQLPAELHGLANVAGASSAAPIETQFRVNFLGTRHLVDAVADRLRSPASVVNVAAGNAMFWSKRFDANLELISTTGFEGGLAWLADNPQVPTTSYARSKEALIMWTLQTATRWVGTGRRINALSPGPVETPMLDEFRSIIGHEVIAADAERSGRAGTAEDLAPIIAFLLSEESHWIHGANIAADGGFSASAQLVKDGWAY
jgi:NAD(P)-dependent dehydrogenase (short-subunit alcohol dehydrogenase family)